MFGKKERIMIALIVFLLFSNVFLIGKILLNRDKSSEMQGFLEENTEIYKPEEPEKKQIIEPDNSKVVVHICGACKNPGIYELNSGERVYDALEKAGGGLPNANLNAVNLAKKLVDSEKVYIPYEGEEQIIETTESNESEGTTTGLININTADKTQLMSLPGVGEKTAQKILSYREKNPFKRKEDIMNVSGIGEKKFQKIEDLITVR